MPCSYVFGVLFCFVFLCFKTRKRVPFGSHSTASLSLVPLSLSQKTQKKKNKKQNKKDVHFFILCTRSLIHHQHTLISPKSPLSLSSFSLYNNGCRDWTEYSVQNNGGAGFIFIFFVFVFLVLGFESDGCGDLLWAVFGAGNCLPARPPRHQSPLHCRLARPRHCSRILRFSSSFFIFSLLFDFCFFDFKWYFEFLHQPKDLQL